MADAAAAIEAGAEAVAVEGVEDEDNERTVTLREMKVLHPQDIDG
jgi:hypothetical protein